jgi:D-3-phosphoglycerate dehydrogenase
VLVVNAARGGVVDIPDLITALDAGKCGGAAIDVYESEPPAESDPLRSHPKVLATPHLGASTSEAQTAVSTDACAQLLEYLRGEGIRGAVNLGGVRLDLDPAQQPFVDLAERMAQIVAVMCDQGMGDISVTLEGEMLASAGSTIERMTVINLLQSQLDDPVNLVNVKLIADQRGIKSSTTIIDEPRTTPRLRISVRSGPADRDIEGSVYSDGLPRVLNICGYHMDMVPEGNMIILQNEDKPGMVGLVGTALAAVNMNIADMTLARHGDKAIMVIKIDEQPSENLIEGLRAKPGILKVTTVELPRIDGE